MTSTIPAVMAPTSWTAMSSCGPARLAAMPMGGGWGWGCCSSAGSPRGCGCARRPSRRSHRPAHPGSVAPCRGCRGRAGRVAGVDGAGCRVAGVSGHERADRGEGDRRAPGPHRLPVRAPVDTAAGADQHRVHRPPIRLAAESDRAGLASRGDRHHRHRPGPVRRHRRRPGRLPASGRRGRHGPRRDRAGPGGVPAGPQQRRLAPTAGDLRHVGHADLRRRRPV